VGEGPVDDVGEAAHECADRFPAGVAAGPASVQVGAGGLANTRLGDRDAVKHGVHALAAGTAEAVPVGVAGAGGLGCGAVVAGVGVTGLEAGDAGGMPMIVAAPITEIPGIPSRFPAIGVTCLERRASICRISRVRSRMR